MEYYAGRIWFDDPFDGYIGVEDGVLKEVGSGTPPEEPVRTGHVAVSVIDGHTHIGDAGLVLDRKYSLEELVAPPNGLKHRYLSSCSDERIVDDMRTYAASLCGDVTEFIDFREGGVKGASLIRRATDRAVVLGRPISREFDVNEVDELLDIADGIGIPSISDMPLSYIEALADATHRRGKILGIHVSERIREDIDTVLSLEPDLLVHMCEATAMDVTKCAEAEVPVAVCPGSNAYFGKEPPVVLLDECGADMMLGTDNAMLRPPDMAVIKHNGDHGQGGRRNGNHISQALPQAFRQEIAQQEKHHRQQINKSHHTQQLLGAALHHHFFTGGGAHIVAGTGTDGSACHTAAGALLTVVAAGGFARYGDLGIAAA